MDDVRKSVSSILYERTTSPFFGTLICSWLLWNWQIVYLTLFVSENKITGNKIDYIKESLVDTHRCITYPLLSTVVLLTIVPFISNGAYWLTLIFTKWRKDKKNEIELQQLLTLEQSIELREQISAQEIRFEKLLESKNLEIKQLQLIIDNNKKDLEQKPHVKKEVQVNLLDEELVELAKRVKENPNEKENYDRLIHHIQRGYKMTGESAPSTQLIALMESYNIINNSAPGFYTLTEIGKKFHRLMVK